MTLDRRRLEQDCYHALEFENPYIQRIAQVVLAALENPAMFIPDAYAIVKKPELLGIGTPAPSRGETQ